MKRGKNIFLVLPRTYVFGKQFFGMTFLFDGYPWSFSAKSVRFFPVFGILLLTQMSSGANNSSCRLMKPDYAMEREAEYYTNTWAVRITGGVHKARGIAKRMGYDFYRKALEGLPNIYLFRNLKYPAKTKYSGRSTTKRLSEHPQIGWTEQQLAEIRVPRRFITRTRSIAESELTWDSLADAYTCPNPRTSLKRALNLNDAYWPKQYYLKDCRESRELSGDLNIAPVWAKHRIFGRNVNVVVIDDGVETRHKDLAENFDRTLGLDLQDGDESPDPEHNWHRKYTHGTRCAGIIGMKANNTICGVGVAPLVTLGAVRLLGPNEQSDYDIGTAFSFKHTRVHIMSNSWGPNDDGVSMPYAGPLTRMALKIGIREGRGGRGIIYVFACGNGKRDGDYCGCDSLVSSIYSIAVASCSHRGKITNYSERCASIMVTAYSGNLGDLDNVVATDIGDKCTSDHVGTSASAPLVAGAIALALEANPRLSWRDVQHLIAWTSQVAPLQYNPPGTWVKNGAGFYVSHDFGFGMLNINYMVEKAKVFRNVGPMNTCVTRATLNEDGEAFRNRLKVELTTTACSGTPFEVKYLEHVQLAVSLGFPRRGDLQIILISPAGTKARLLDPRPYDSYPFGISFWNFDSIMTWGESPKGKWTIHISSGRRRAGPYAQLGSSIKKFWSSLKYTRDGAVCYPGGDDVPKDTIHVGELNDLILTFHGTSGRYAPHHYRGGRRTYDDFTLPL